MKENVKSNISCSLDLAYANIFSCYLCGFQTFRLLVLLKDA